jgi:hypothetical protein
LTDKPDHEASPQELAKGYDRRYGCLLVAVVCVLLAIMAVAAALIGKGFPTAIGYLEMSALLMIIAVVSSAIAAIGFITRKSKRRSRP